MESVSNDGERKPQPGAAEGGNRERPDGAADGNTERAGQMEVKPGTEPTAAQAQAVPAEPPAVSAEHRALPAETPAVSAETPGVAAENQAVPAATQGSPAETLAVPPETQAAAAETQLVAAGTQAVTGSGPAQSSDERTWALVTHLSALAGYAIPFGHVFGPLLVWILKRETLPAVDEHGKESLNFQLSCTIYAIVSLILVVVGIGILLLLAVAIFDLVFIIIAAVKAYNGEPYRYPLSIRFIK
jgi:uncharacterized Tic20 family protein